MSWTPGRNKAKRALEQPYPDVPDHLYSRLWEWIARSFRSPGSSSTSTARVNEIQMAMRLDLPDGSAGVRLAALRDMCEQDTDFMLDLVESLLDHYRDNLGNAPALESLLIAANSAYAVKDDFSGLTERQAAGIAEQVQQVVTDADQSVSEHLIAAWNSAYGYTKNPVHAYTEAIRAAETALRPIVCSGDHKTIFRMIGLVNDNPQDFKFVLTDHRPTAPANAPAADGVQVVLDLMRLLAYSEPKRHGGSGRNPTEDEAKAAVMTAVTIVQYCDSGAFAHV